MKRTFTAIAALGILSTPVQAETYKVRLSGDWWSSSYEFLVVEVEGQTIKPRFVDHNNAGGTFKPASAKWFDYPATAVRACPVGSGSWANSQDCFVSEADSITLPDGQDLDNYRFDFKYNKGGALTEHSFSLQDLKVEKVVKNGSVKPHRRAR